MPPKRDLEAMSDDDLVALRSQIDDQLDRRKAKKREEVTAQIKDLAEKAGISVRELMRLGGFAASGKAGSVPPKFRHPEDKNITWSGRGGVPGWVRDWEARGKKRDELLIK